MIFILLSNNLEKEIETNKSLFDFIKLMKIDFNTLLSSKRNSQTSNPSYHLSKSKPGTAF